MCWYAAKKGGSLLGTPHYKYAVRGGFGGSLLVESGNCPLGEVGACGGKISEVAPFVVGAKPIEKGAAVKAVACTPSEEAGRCASCGARGEAVFDVEVCSFGASVLLL